MRMSENCTIYYSNIHTNTHTPQGMTKRKHTKTFISHNSCGVVQNVLIFFIFSVVLNVFPYTWVVFTIRQGKTLF